MKTHRKIRVRAVNADVIVSALLSAGFSARSLGPGTACTDLDRGCADEDCCAQHPARYAPLEWAAIETGASGRQVNLVIRQLYADGTLPLAPRVPLTE